MGKLESLETYLDNWSTNNSQRLAIAKTVMSFANASIVLGELIARAPLDRQQLRAHDGNGDIYAQQKRADIKLTKYADALFVDALGSAPVKIIGSKLGDITLTSNEDASLAVLLNPMVGLSAVEANLPVGAIFSILPTNNTKGEEITDALMQSGAHQLAAGFAVFGPQTCFVLTLGSGTFIFTLEPKSSQFFLSAADVRIADCTQEYAVDASHYHLWEEPVRAYIDDCISNNSTSVRGKFKLRWVGSLISETYRILVCGGIYLCPQDDRPGHENRQRQLLFEANPIALLVRQANGLATDGNRDILEIVPTDLHQRVPLIFGSNNVVDRFIDYHTDRNSMISRSPLFARRGLFRG